VLDLLSAMERCSIREAALRLQGSHAAGRAPGTAYGTTRRKLVRKKRECDPPLGFSLDVDRRHTYLALRGRTRLGAQKELLTHRFSKIVLLLPGDATGRAATSQVAGTLAPACSVTERLLPPGVQPDQMTVDQIRQLLAGAGRREALEAP